MKASLDGVLNGGTGGGNGAGDSGTGGSSGAGSGSGSGGGGNAAPTISTITPSSGTTVPQFGPLSMAMRLLASIRMNKNTSNAAQQPQLTVSNSRLYLSWIETSGAKFQIRVALYNGNDSAPSWLFVDGKNVDISKGALKFSEQFHSLDKKKFRYVAADVFSWVESLPPQEKFDVIIVDPPSMASETKQISVALKAYSRVYKRVLPHLKPKGMMIVCCCTSRITRQQFNEVAKKSFSTSLRKMKSLPPEDDHPVGFPQGDYLKLLVFTD